MFVTLGRLSLILRSTFTSFQSLNPTKALVLEAQLLLSFVLLPIKVIQIPAPMLTTQEKMAASTFDLSCMQPAPMRHIFLNRMPISLLFLTGTCRTHLLTQNWGQLLIFQDVPHMDKPISIQLNRRY